jgi:hypothetical protein
MKATHILPIFTFLCLFAPHAIAQVEDESQDVIVTMWGDTIPCSVKFTGSTFGVVMTGDKLATEVQSDTILSFRQFGLWRIPERKLLVKSNSDIDYSVDLNLSKRYLKNAGTGFAVAGVLTVLGSGVLIAGNLLAQSGNLDAATAFTPTYFGYGLLVVAGLTTIGASVSLSKAGKSLPNVRLRIANQSIK